MKHIRKFNKINESYLSAGGGIHDSLLYNSGLDSDLDAYAEIEANLEVNKSELPQEAQDLIREIDTIIENVHPVLRTKIIRLYSILADDDSLES